jgi:nitroreductase
MDFKELAEKRRSINHFDSEREIDDTILRKIFDLAVLSPSAYNFQPWNIIAVKSDESKRRLYGFAGKQQKILDASATLIMIGDRNGYNTHNPVWSDLREKLGEEKTNRILGANEKLYGSTEERKIKFGEVNTGLFAMSIMYAAENYGLNSHPVGGIDFEGIKREFDIANEKEVVMLICLGYFNELKTLKARKKRKSFEEIVKII